MRQAARRTYRIACPTGRPGCRENHPLPDPLPALPTTRLIHTSRLSPAPRSRPGTPPFYVRARTSREREFLVPPVQAPAPGKSAPACHTDYDSTPAIPAPQNQRGLSRRCIVRRPSG
eukprot:254618_1